MSRLACAISAARSGRWASWLMRSLPRMNLTSFARPTTPTALPTSSPLPCRRRWPPGWMSAAPVTGRCGCPGQPAARRNGGNIRSMTCEVLGERRRRAARDADAAGPRRPRRGRYRRPGQAATSRIASPDQLAARRDLGWSGWLGQHPRHHSRRHRGRRLEGGPAGGGFRGGHHRVDLHGGGRVHLRGVRARLLPGRTSPGVSRDRCYARSRAAGNPRHLRRQGLRRRTARSCRRHHHRQPRELAGHDDGRETAPEASQTPKILRSAVVITIATLIGPLIPLLPFAWLSRTTALITAIVLSGLVLFGVGVYESVTLVGDWRKNGLKMVVIGLGAAAIGFLIGRLFHTAGA